MRRAIIIAAGQGSRLDAQGQTSKPLVNVAGEPLLFRILRTLEQAGIDEAVVVTGFMHQRIEKALREWRGKLEVSTVHNPIWEKGNGTSVLAAARHVSGPTILSMSDHLYPSEVVERLLSATAPADATLLAIDRDIDGVFDLEDATKVQLKGERIVDIGKDIPHVDALDVGVFRISQGLIEALRETAERQRGRLSLSDGVRTLAQKGRMRGVDVTGNRWIDVDDAKSLKHAQLLVTCYGDTLAQPFEGDLNPLLMNPGPVCISPRVNAALGSRRMCHRDPDFSVLLDGIQSKLRTLFEATPEHDLLVLTTSGTGAVESMISTFVPAGKSLLVLSNGAFGERIAEIAQTHGIPLVHEALLWGALLRRIPLEKVLDKHPEVGAVAMVHHETSVAVRNPLTEIGRVVRKRGLLFLVDAVSSFGAEDLDVERDCIDVCAASSNKCLHAPSGVAPLCVGPRAWEAIARDERPRSYYLDLRRYRKSSIEKVQTPFTPAVRIYLALDAALDELLESGVEARRASYRTMSDLLVRRLAELGIERWEPEGERASGLSVFTVPPFLDYATLYEDLKHKGFIIYECKGALLGRYFQVATMGDMSVRDIERFALALEEILVLRRPRTASIGPSSIVCR